jgi:hypothetical protein
MKIPKRPRKHLRSRLVNLLLTILVGYVVALVLLRIFESHLVFFPNYPGRLEGDWHPRTLPVQDVWLTASDCTKLHAWWIPHDQAKFTFLAFHGNASNIANRAPVYEFLHSLPVNVFALEYRGYGRSEGHPSEAGLYRDADAAYLDLVATKSIDLHPRSTCITHKTNSFKPSRIKTYTNARPNSFRINTYKKGEGRGYTQAERRPHPGTAIRGCVFAGAKGARMPKLSAITLHSQIPTSPANRSHCHPCTVCRSHTSNRYCLADQCV